MEKNINAAVCVVTDCGTVSTGVSQVPPKDCPEQNCSCAFVTSLGRQGRIILDGENVSLLDTN